MRVAVLGCGPAGLMAAHAARRHDAHVKIFSVKQMSPMGGAQYLHESIPDITPSTPHGILSYAKIGNSTGYAEKVYNSPLAPTSWNKFPTGEHPAWSLKLAYQKLASIYWDTIEDVEVKADDLETLCMEWDLVLSTIPAYKLCRRQGEGVRLRHAHWFNSQPVLLVPDGPQVPNMILYSGRTFDDWYRTSNIFGTRWTEYALHPGRAMDIPDGGVRGMKPIEAKCDCNMRFDNFIPLGRFGQWRKGVLTSDAFKDADELIKERMYLGAV